MIGTTLGHFKITAKLGEGGMGEVYRADDLELKREVAIKVLPPAVAQDPQRLERFRREAETVAALNHPNIVTLYSIESTEGTAAGAGLVHFLVLELVDGEALDSVLQRGGLSLTKVLDYAQAIGEALTTAHEKGIVHRDLKPANVMLTGDGRIKVLDFGLAKLAERSTAPRAGGETQLATLTEEGRVMGTAPYMSPEQAQGEAVDARTDIFSLGSMLYEMATGSRPFAGDSTIDTLHKIVHAEPEPLGEQIPDAPLQLQWILRKALAKSPENRYQSARDLVVDLKALRRDLDTDLNLPTVSSGAIPAVQASGRQRSAVYWGTLATVALVAVAGLFWSLGRRTGVPKVPASTQATMTKTPITASGLVTSAAISPDGKFVAYVEALQGEQSLHLRQVGGAESLQLIEPEQVYYWGITFNPGSSAVLYGLKSPEDSVGAIYQISTLGGTPRKLVAGIDSQPAFSPDGTRIAWLLAKHPEQDKTSMMVANADGSDPRVLATWDFPEIVVPIFFAGPSWSPDGRLIATSVLTVEGHRAARVVAVDAATGAIEWTAQDEWQWSAMVGWLPDGEGLLAIAIAMEGSDAQIWWVPYPEGAAQQLTSDLFDYRIISLTADGTSLLTIAASGRSDIFAVPADGSKRPRKLSRSRLDGAFGFDFTPAGDLVYQTLEGGRLDLALMSLDGTKRQRLTDDEEEDRYPVVAPDGRIVVRTRTAEGFQIRRLDPDGGNQQFLARGLVWGKADISPDGRWVVYDSVSDVVPKIWRVPLDGGTPEQVIDVESFNPAISPDGSRMAFYFRDPDDGTYKIGVASFETGELELDLGRGTFYGSTLLRWAQDGAAVLTNTRPGDRANLYRIPLDGGEPERLTDFDDQRLLWFEFAPDGETLVITRGGLSRDAVLIENFLPER